MKERQTKEELVEAKAIEADDEQWVPASLLDTIDGLDRERFAYRWTSKDPSIIRKRIAEGWTFVKEADGDHVLHRRSKDRSLEDGSALTSETEYRDVVMMKLPMARANARRRYFQKKTDRATEMVNREAQSEGAAKGVEIKPTIRIQSGNDVNVIE